MATIFTAEAKLQENSSLSYSMRKGDTLWSLAKTYLADPYRWPEIEKADGSPIGNPRRMSIGTQLFIPVGIANDLAKQELSPSKRALNIDQEEKGVVGINTYPFSYYITQDAEKVIIYRDGTFITIPKKDLVSNGVNIKQLGKNVNVDKKLLDKLFKKEI